MTPEFFKKKPLEFLNPLLYSRTFNVLNDIAAGNDPGCGTSAFNILFYCNLSLRPDHGLSQAWIQLPAWVKELVLRI
ncbi:hypothetical protein PILCRDRAFT_169971 [Piloderma croceum F 1598]|uniref:Uncharacterized protein n=1 Tax=Piloderma croceum (strain F 1598) TaxID=765440 RepID=A0A0C3CNF6_PILCF|nr:hypothetical protein PILCRDRAFT_169971 [Piloderma croceum F 1598]